MITTRVRVSTVGISAQRHTRCCSRQRAHFSSLAAAEPDIREEEAVVCEREVQGTTGADVRIVRGPAANRVLAGLLGERPFLDVAREVERLVARGLRRVAARERAGRDRCIGRRIVVVAVAGRGLVGVRVRRVRPRVTGSSDDRGRTRAPRRHVDLIEPRAIVLHVDREVVRARGDRDRRGRAGPVPRAVARAVRDRDRYARTRGRAEPRPDPARGGVRRVRAQAHSIRAGGRDRELVVEARCGRDRGRGRRDRRAAIRARQHVRDARVPERVVLDPGVTRIGARRDREVILGLDRHRRGGRDCDRIGRRRHDRAGAMPLDIVAQRRADGLACGERVAIGHVRPRQLARRGACRALRRGRAAGRGSEPTRGGDRERGRRDRGDHVVLVVTGHARARDRDHAPDRQRVRRRRGERRGGAALRHTRDGRGATARARDHGATVGARRIRLRRLVLHHLVTATDVDPLEPGRRRREHARGRGVIDHAVAIVVDVVAALGDRGRTGVGVPADRRTVQVGRIADVRAGALARALFAVIARQALGRLRIVDDAVAVVVLAIAQRLGLDDAAGLRHRRAVVADPAIGTIAGHRRVDRALADRRTDRGRRADLLVDRAIAIVIDAVAHLGARVALRFAAVRRVAIVVVVAGGAREATRGERTGRNRVVARGERAAVTAHAAVVDIGLGVEALVDRTVAIVIQVVAELEARRGEAVALLRAALTRQRAGVAEPDVRAARAPVAVASGLAHGPLLRAADARLDAARAHVREAFVEVAVAVVILRVAELRIARVVLEALAHDRAAHAVVRARGALADIGAALAAATRIAFIGEPVAIVVDVVAGLGRRRFRALEDAPGADLHPTRARALLVVTELADIR